MFQQPKAPSKKPRLGPKIGSQDWGIEKLKETPKTNNIKHSTTFTDYQLGRFKILVEYDYKVLGEVKVISGPPDIEKHLDYPITYPYKPDYFKEFPLVWKD